VNPSSKSYITEVKSHKVSGVAAQAKIGEYTHTFNPQDFHQLVFETYGLWEHLIAVSSIIGYQGSRPPCNGRTLSQ
jgi:hypothetical protein